MIIINQNDRSHEFISDERKASRSAIKQRNSLISCYLAAKKICEEPASGYLIRDGKECERWDRQPCITKDCSCKQIQANCERIIIDHEEKLMSTEVRLQGLLKNMTHDEWKKYFNDNESALEELKELLFLCEKKPVLESSTKELQDNIDILERSIRILSIVTQSKKAKLADIIDNAEEEEREEIRKRDKSYKVAPVEKVEKKAAPKSIINAEEKMKNGMRSLGMTEEEIENFIIEKKAGRK